MSSGLWLPGTAPPTPPSVEEFLNRVHGQIAAFAQECQCDQADVVCQLFDGRTLRLQSISPAPGLGWVTLRPFPDDEDEAPDDGPLEMVMVPIGSIVRISVRMPERGHRRRKFNRLQVKMQSSKHGG